jgi:hypothetical protein
MVKTPITPLGLKGLVTDVPSQSLALDYFDSGNNMRSINGALSGVNSFANETNIGFGTSGGAVAGIYDAVQFTPAGSQYYNIFALVKSGSTFTVRGFSQNSSQFSGSQSITVSTSGVTDWTGSNQYSTEYGSDMLVFNEVLIVNLGTHVPMYMPSQGAALINFPTGKTEVISGSTVAVPLKDWPTENTLTNQATHGGQDIYAGKISKFGNRVVAMSMYGDVDYNERATIFFSSPIKDISSIQAIEWLASNTNSASDDIITESPGPVLDGGQLGANFIVYKSDSVLSYMEVSSEPFIVGRAIQDDDGIISSRCFEAIGNSQHIVFGNYGVYIHNGENQKQVVSKNKIHDALYADIDRTRVNQCFTFRHNQDKETWFCIPTSSLGSGKEGCDKAYCYAEETDSWYTRDLENYTHIFTTELLGVTRIFALSPDNAQLQELSSTAVIASGSVEFLNRPLDTNATVKTMTAMYPMSNGTLNIGVTSTDNIPTSASITTKSFNPVNDHKLGFRETGRYFDLKVQLPSTTDVKLTGAEFEIKPRGKR